MTTRADLIKEARAASKNKRVWPWIAELSEFDIDRLLSCDSCPVWLTKCCEHELQRRITNKGAASMEMMTLYQIKAIALFNDARNNRPSQTEINLLANDLQEVAEEHGQWEEDEESDVIDAAASLLLQRIGGLTALQGYVSVLAAGARRKAAQHILASDVDTLVKIDQSKLLEFAQLVLRAKG